MLLFYNRAVADSGRVTGVTPHKRIVKNVPFLMVEVFRVVHFRTQI